MTPPPSDHRANSSGGGPGPASPAQPMSSAEEVPTSYAEDRSVRVWRLTGHDSMSRRLEDGLRVRGPLDAAALEQAFNHVLRRHEVLWSQYTIEGEGEKIRKRIVPPVEVQVAVEDLRGLPEAARLDAALDAAAREVNVDVDITRDAPLMWLKGWRLGEADHLLFLNAAHCVVDTTAYRLLWDDIARAYGHFAKGGAPPAEPRPRQYVEFSRWQRQWYQSDEKERWAAYWSKRLEGSVPLTLCLPTERGRDGVDRVRKAVHVAGAPAGAFPWQTPPGLAEKLVALGQARGFSAYSVAYGAMAVLFARLARRSDVAVATLNNTRNRVPGFDEVVGYFNNNMLLRVDLAGDPSYQEALARADQVVAEVRGVPEFQLVPFIFPRLTDLFRVLFNYVGPGMEAPPRWPGLVLEAIPMSEILRRGPPMKYHIDLVFRVSRPDDQTFQGTLVYNKELWTAQTMRTWASEYVGILEDLVARPEASARVP